MAIDVLQELDQEKKFHQIPMLQSSFYLSRSGLVTN